jgi:hypothetical protein
MEYVLLVLSSIFTLKALLIIIVILIVILLVSFFYQSFTWPARDLLRYEEDYQKASTNEKEQLVWDRMGAYQECRYISGVLVGPGEEINALMSELDYLDDFVEDKDQAEAQILRISEFIGAAEEQLDTLRMNLSDRDDEEEKDSLENEVEDAEEVIENAKRIVKNPEETLQRWKG